MLQSAGERLAEHMVHFGNRDRGVSLSINTVELMAALDLCARKMLRYGTILSKWPRICANG